MHIIWNLSTYLFIYILFFLINFFFLQNIAQVAADSSYFTRFGLNVIIRQTNSKPIVEMSPREFMFGYESRLLTLGNQFMPGWIKFEKLGLIDRVSLRLFYVYSC